MTLFNKSLNKKTSFIMDTSTTFNAIGVLDFDKWLEPKKFSYNPASMGPLSIEISIDACGICGSDIHAAAGDWGRAYTPLAVGHEIIGRIVSLGDEVDKSKFHLGDRVGVGPVCDCCHECNRCKDHKEVNCKKGVLTYLGVDPKTGVKTQGGYADRIRVDSRWVFKIPDALESKHAAPLLCGGITGFKPLLTAKVGKGTKVGIVGIGGIGHMTMLFAKALGAEVTAISRSNRKKNDAFELGASDYIATAEEGYELKNADSLDVLVVTTSSFSGSNLDKMLTLLKPAGRMIFITAPPMDEKLTVTPMTMLMNDYVISGSASGSPHEVEYMLEFAAKHDIKPWVETIDISEPNVAKSWQRMLDGDVKYRFVLTGYDKCF